MDKRKNHFFIVITAVFLLASLSSCTAHPAEYSIDPLYERKRETHVSSQTKVTVKGTEAPDQPSQSINTDQACEKQHNTEFSGLTESQSDPAFTSEQKDPTISAQPTRLNETAAIETEEPITSTLTSEELPEKKTADTIKPSESIAIVTTQEATVSAPAETVPPATPTPAPQTETAIAAPAPTDSYQLSNTEMAEEIFQQLNAYRQENGLPAFKRGEALMWKAAQIRTEEVLLDLDHWRPNNRSCNDVMWEVGIGDHYTLMSECISHCAPWDDAQFIAYYWDRSWSHKMYILSPDHTTAAIGYINRGDDGQYTVLIMTDDKK
jgi:uncharacterized protein YkwD